jgi:hypothetical protein
MATQQQEKKGRPHINFKNREDSTAAARIKTTTKQLQGKDASHHTAAARRGKATQLLEEL